VRIAVRRPFHLRDGGGGSAQTLFPFWALFTDWYWAPPLPLVFWNQQVTGEILVRSLILKELSLKVFWNKDLTGFAPLFSGIW
jgi:hypothetical protein